jgi:hypothetical protein
MAGMVEQLATVRGRHLKALLARVASRPDGPTVLARLPPDLLRQVAEAGGLDWLPVAHNVAIARAIFDTLGCGTWTVSELGPGQTSVRLDLAGVPQACAEDPFWFRAVGHSLSALLILAREQGSVDLLPRQRLARDASFEFHGGARAAMGWRSPPR